MKTFNFFVFSSFFIFFAIILGGIIDSYVSSFFPTMLRLKLLLKLMLGCISMALVIQIIYCIERGSFLMANFTKFALICSFFPAIYTDFQEFFLLIYAAFLIFCFYFIFGFLGNIFNRRYNDTVSIGAANGVLLAWTFSTAIPLYIPWIANPAFAIVSNGLNNLI